MPLYGRLDIQELTEHAATLSSFSGEPLELPRTEVLQLMFEVDPSEMQASVPRAVHPTIPPTATFVFWRCPDGPLGAFQLAQVRIGCRAGISPCNLLVACWCDSQSAANILRERWGFCCRTGTVRLMRGYARVSGEVTEGGRSLLRASLVDPVAISGADIQYVASLHVARVPRESGLETRLVQVAPEYAFHQAERGRPVLEHFERDANTARVRPVYPVSASLVVCDIRLPPIRYVLDPDQPALRGTETVLPVSPGGS